MFLSSTFPSKGDKAFFGYKQLLATTFIHVAIFSRAISSAEPCR
jgi:hypothetical protein